MKKIYLLGLTALTLANFTACKDDTDPKLDTSVKYDFHLNTPPMANQYIDLSTDGILTFTVSQPDYGLTLAPTYGLEISLNSDFTTVSDNPVIDSEGLEHVIPGSYTLILEGANQGVLTVKMSTIAAGINELNGVFEPDMYTGDYEGSLYVRATAAVGDGHSSMLTATTSNVVTLAQVKGYYVAPAADDLVLCVPGGGNGWTNSVDSPNLVSTDDGLTYKGFAYISGGFKITDGDWDAPNWGAGDAGEGTVEGLVYDEATGTYSGPLFTNGGNLNDTGEALEAGMYFIQVDVTNIDSAEGEQGATITLTPIKSVCIQGDYCGWDFGSAVEMTPDGNSTYTATGSFTSAGWKFAFNGEWTINLGGSMDRLTFDGDNINVDASEITLDLSIYPWNCKVQ